MDLTPFCNEFDCHIGQQNKLFLHTHIINEDDVVNVGI
jgi:hypothetical protein